MSIHEPDPTEAVPPSDRPAYQPIASTSEPPPSNGPATTGGGPTAPVPPASWPRQEPPSRPGPTRRRRRRGGVFPLVALLVWGGGVLGGHDGGSDDTTSQFSSERSSGDGTSSAADGSTMDWLKPHSVHDGQQVRITAGPAKHSTYTVLVDGAVRETTGTDSAFSYVIPSQDLGSTVVVRVDAALGPGSQLGCEITSDDVPIAEGAGMGSLQCTYDPAILKE